MNDVLARVPPSRSAALDRLAKFVPSAGRKYASGRNTDDGPDAPSAVSRLSPYVRYRLITEHEVVAAVLGRHSLLEAEKYVQEVLWRTYWKGWLEMRPSAWMRFLEDRDRQRESFPNARALAAAESGSTGIEGFDDWARELVATGYLHNHARMWFASIWIFTLRLPWVLGADFFLRHLLDADAASNTLSWRWVAGLQTAGKTYLATADNIARNTNGRFAPVGLSNKAVALTEPPLEPARGLPDVALGSSGERALLLVTHEDMHPESLVPEEALVDAVLVIADAALLWGNGARAFVKSAADDAAHRISSKYSCTAEVLEALDAATLIAAAQAAGVRQIVTAYAPVGPVADTLAKLAPALEKEGIVLAQFRRRWDAQFWPHAKKGFFGLKDRIPAILREEGLQ
jgi:deoxyribodipyrimidine photo-lyase